MMQNKKLVKGIIVIVTLLFSIVIIIFTLQNKIPSRDIDPQVITENVILDQIHQSQLEYFGVTDKETYEEIVIKKEDCCIDSDLKIYDKAIENNDEYLCESIDNQLKRSACHNIVHNMNNFTQENFKKQEFSSEYIIPKSITGEESIYRYENLVKKYPDDLSYRLYLALTYINTGINMGESRKVPLSFIEKVTENIKKENIVNDESSFFMRALEQINEAEKLAPENVDVYRMKSFLYLSYLQWEQAEEFAHKAIELAQAHANKSAYIYNLLTLVQYQQKEYNNAIESSEKALMLLENEQYDIDITKKIKRNLYSVLVGVYHQVGDVNNEEEYKKLISTI